MDFLSFLFDTDIADYALRFGPATVMGAAIGVDREWRSRPAGLRTHMLTALAAAVFTVLTFELYEEFSEGLDQPSADPMRIIEAVTAGVAFLAAGTIIHGAGKIRGLTTGAGMWLAGALGLACGSGRFDIAFVALVLAIVVISILRPVEDFVTRDDKDENG